MITQYLKRYVHIVHGCEVTRDKLLYGDNSFTETFISGPLPKHVWFRALIMLNLVISMQSGDNTRGLIDQIWS